MTNTYNPDSVSPPGETLKELMHGNRCTPKEFAEKYEHSITYLNWVLEGKASMIATLIRDICLEFETSKEFWEQRDRRYWEWKNAER